MKPAFIYFDLDDTLLDHKSAEQGALTDVHRQFDFLHDIEAARLIEVYHHINKNLWERYGTGKLSREQLQRFRFEYTFDELGVDATRFEQVGIFYMRCYRNHWKWVTGASKALEKIGTRYPVGILTNGFAETQRRKFEHFSLHERTEHLVISEEVGYLKPQPEIFAHATELAGSKPADILYIGDSFASDIVGGSSFGWRTAWFTTETDKHKLQQAGFAFDNFEDLCRFLEV